MEGIKISTSWGEFKALIKNEKLLALFFPNKGPEIKREISWTFASLFSRMLNLYLQGEKIDFSSIPVDISKATDFQRLVWEKVLLIPYGTTITYKQLAERIKKPSAARAVGQALAKNPLPIVIPCHRVVGKNTLGGYSGGLNWKRKLISLECEE